MAKISIKNMTKNFRIYKRNSQMIKDMLFKTKTGMVKTALHKINLEIEKGENVAVMGRLGAGKSTLLRAIAGNAIPNHGSITINGEVNSMISMVSGFDRGLNGRDNMYFKGSMLGHHRKTIKEHMDEIIEFTDSADYIDMPMKNYPPGMASRIGFALHLLIKKPDILIMDEPFSVGSLLYRNKCLDKLDEIVHDPEVTFVMVTRNYILAKRFCERGIVLEKGEILFDGTVHDAYLFYKDFLAKLPKEEGGQGTRGEPLENDYDEDEEEGVM